MKKLLTNLNFQVLAGIVLGIIAGALFKSFGPTAQIITKTFIGLISMLIGPIIFFTIVLGIAGMSDMKKVGRVGGKALLYFEIVSTLALVIGLVVANVVRPGDHFAGHILADPSKLETYKKAAADMSLVGVITHIVPVNIFDAFVKGDIIQILFFAILFGFGLSFLEEEGQQVISLFEKISKVFFNIMRMVLRLAPIGAFAGMAWTVSTYGISTLQSLGWLLASVYLTSLFFIFGVLGLVCYLYKFSLWKYLKFIKQEILMVWGTSSSESVLAAMMERMEEFGCSKAVVKLVIPAGYSFNLDGTTIYLSMSVIFLTQAFHVPITFWQEVVIIAILMVTSKGAAGVTGSGFIILTSTLAAIKIIPLETVGILFGVDRFMSEARAITNMIGNGIATIVIAKSEGEFDEKRLVTGD